MLAVRACLSSSSCDELLADFGAQARALAAPPRARCLGSTSHGKPDQRERARRPTRLTLARDDRFPRAGRWVSRVPL